MTTRPNGAGPAAIDAGAPKTRTATSSEPARAKRERKLWSNVTRAPSHSSRSFAPSETFDRLTVFVAAIANKLHQIARFRENSLDHRNIATVELEAKHAGIV